MGLGRVSIRSILSQPWESTISTSNPPLNNFLLLPKPKHTSTSEISDILTKYGIDNYSDEGCVVVPIYGSDGSHENYNAFRHLIYNEGMGRDAHFVRIQNKLEVYEKFLHSPAGKKKFVEYISEAEIDASPAVHRKERFDEIGVGIVQGSLHRGYIITPKAFEHYGRDLEQLIDEFRGTNAHISKENIDGLGKVTLISGSAAQGHKNHALDQRVREKITGFVDDFKARNGQTGGISFP